MTFADLLPFTLAREGGYVDDVLDRGGATNRGITTATYDRWRKSKGLAIQPVKLCTPEETEAIYRDWYWHPIHGDDLLIYDPNVALQVFDMGVNAGTGTAVKLLQGACGAVEDGVMGAQTLGQVMKMDKESLRDSYMAARQAHYRAIVGHRADQAKFLPGWLKRVDLIRRAV